MNILLIRLMGLGDVASILVPAVTLYKLRYPDAAITALSGSEFTDDFRVVATFETVGGSQEPQSAA